VRLLSEAKKLSFLEVDEFELEGEEVKLRGHER
jgi:hypothetical protein